MRHIRAVCPSCNHGEQEADSLVRVQLLTPGLNIEQFYTSNVTRQVSAAYGAGLYGTAFDGIVQACSFNSMIDHDVALSHLGSQALELPCTASHVMAWCRHALEIMDHDEALPCLESQAYDNSEGW